MSSSTGAVTPQTIPNQPIPMLDTSFQNTNSVPASAQLSSIDSENGMQPATIKNAEITQSPIASDVVATSLDTQQRRILGNFSFGKVGGLQVGAYEAGVSGQINISPNGIIAKNSSNQTTFSLDGTTGDAFFSGSLTLGGTNNSNGIFKLYDGSGNLIIQEDNAGIKLYNQTALQLADAVNGPYAYFGPGSGQVVMQTVVGVGMLFSLNADSTFQMGAFNQDTLSINGNLNVNSGSGGGGNINATQLSTGSSGWVYTGNLSVTAATITIGGSVKSAIVETTQGYKALYCAEAPEVWFFDFAKDQASIDPLFLEATEGEMKVIRCEDGSLQVWRRRKGHSKKRFESKTALQYMRNNAFWGQPL